MAEGGESSKWWRGGQREGGSQAPLIRDPETEQRCGGSGSLRFLGLRKHKASLHLRQGSALPLHTYQKYFFRLSIIVFEHCIPSPGSPQQAVAKINPVLQLLPWQSSRSLSTLPRNLKIPYLFQWHRYIPKYDTSLIITRISFLGLHCLAWVGLSVREVASIASIVTPRQ